MRNKLRATKRPSLTANLIRCAAILAVTGLGAPVYADVAANRCSTRVLDFGTDARGSINISASNPATMDIGTVTNNVAERWQTKSPYNARAGWWPSKGGDHTDPGNGYFLLMDIKPNSQNKVVYTNTLSGLEIGGNYSASLWLASAFYASSPQVDVELLNDKGDVVTVVNKPVLPNATNTDLFWQKVNLPFTASSSSQTIQIKEAADTNSSGNDLALDDISLTHECPPNVTPVATPSISGASQIGATLTGTHTYADDESDIEDPIATTYKFVTSPNTALTSSSGGATVAIGATGGASASVSYTLQTADLNLYVYYCVIPAAQTGTSPGLETCSPASDIVTDKPTPPKPPAPTPVPTLGEWSLIGLTTLMVMLGISRLRRRQH
jgi:hypothetical protein